MSSLSPTEQMFFDIAKGSLPRWLFPDGTSDATSVLAAFAKQFAPIFSAFGLQQQNTFITVADSNALDQHAKDRGTRRQLGETDIALSKRLRFMLVDTITVAALLSNTTALLQAAGLTSIPSGYPAMVELRRDRAFLGSSLGVQITAVAAASIADGATFSIGGTVYEFDKNGSITTGNVRVNISSATSAIDVSDAIVAAMTAKYGALVYAASGYVIVRRAPGALAQTVGGSFSIARQRSYLSRGRRIGSPSRGSTELIAILPYGTPDAAVEAIAESLRQIAAGGVLVVVERRSTP